MIARYLGVFPNLNPAEDRVVSPETADYNCIAWAAEVEDRWWWPDPMEQEYWPPGVPRESTLQAFEAAYGTLGYSRCSQNHFEPGFQKIAIYAKGGVPQHAARQLPDGRWTSKLGELHDIEHVNLAGVESAAYGKVALILRRPSS